MLFPSATKSPVEPSLAPDNSRDFTLSAMVVMGSQIPQDSLQSEKGKTRAQQEHQPGQILHLIPIVAPFSASLTPFAHPKAVLIPPAHIQAPVPTLSGRLCFVQSRSRGRAWCGSSLQCLPRAAASCSDWGVCRRHSRVCQDLQGQSPQQGVCSDPWQPQPVLPPHIPTWPSLLYLEKSFQP